MRALGYPRVVSMESFRTPNFELVADCLEFLVTRYDETAVVEGDISAEADRVRFLKNVNEVFAQKARARLNLKRLYSADGVAVKEWVNNTPSSAMRSKAGVSITGSP